MRSVICAIVGVLAAAAAACAQGDPATLLQRDYGDQRDHRAEALVQQLSSPQFSAREQAHRELMRLGPAALSAVQEGRRHADPEVRERCARLLPLIRREHQRQLLAGLVKGELPDQPIPGWQAFARMVGDTPALRAFYARMLGEEWEFIAYVEQHPNDALNAIAFRCELLKQGGTAEEAETIDSIAAIYFATLLPPSIPDGIITPVYIMCYYRGFQISMRSGGNPALRELMAAWVTHVQCSLERQMDVLRIGLDFGLDECLDRARTVVQDPQASPLLLARSITAIHRFGSHAELPLLEDLLDDERTVDNSISGRRNPRAPLRIRQPGMEAQVRDIALYAAVMLSGDDPLNYGFQSGVAANGNTLDVQQIRFVSDEHRVEGLDRWRHVRSEDPK